MSSYHYSVPHTDSMLSGKLHHVEIEMNLYSRGDGGMHKQIEITSYRLMTRCELEEYIRGFFNIYDTNAIFKL